MQPTPTRSPSRNFVTSLPARRTRPTISWPGTIGNNDERPHSSRAWWMSVWQMPQKRISMATSRGRGARRSKEYGASGCFAAGTA